MKRYLTLCAVATTILTGTIVATLSLPRPAESRQTQGEMNEQAARDYARADAELNKVYKKLLTKLDATGQAKLKKAQRAWIAYRDSNADLAADFARGGTMEPMLYSGACAEATRARTKELEGYLKEYSDH